MQISHRDTNSRDQLLDTIEGVGRRLGVGRSTIYKLIDTKQIETVKIGRSIRIPLASVDLLIERLRGAA